MLLRSEKHLSKDKCKMEKLPKYKCTKHMVNKINSVLELVLSFVELEGKFSTTEHKLINQTMSSRV